MGGLISGGANAEAPVALRKLCRHFKIREPRLELTSGNRTSRANGRFLRLNRDYASWLLLVHELAHTWHDQRGRNGDRWHGRTHRRLVDRLARYVVKQRWSGGAIAAAHAETEQRQEAAAVARRNPTREVKIARRRAQVARLDRKIKALTSRRKTAARSLAALERAQQREDAALANAAGLR